MVYGSLYHDEFPDPEQTPRQNHSGVYAYQIVQNPLHFFRDKEVLLPLVEYLVEVASHRAV